MAVTFPRTDAALLAWGQNFYTVANAGSATLYGLTSAQCTAFNTLVTAYQTALAACEPGQRNKQAVSAKNAARTSLKTSARLLSNIVEGQATVTDAQKIALGINVRQSPSPTPIPTTSPVIQVASVSGFLITLRLRASAGSKARGKPTGVIGASIFSFIGDVAPTDLSQWTFQGNTGKTQVNVDIPNTTAKGATVWFTAFWFNGAKYSGPMTAPISTTVQGGSVSMSERKAA